MSCSLVPSLLQLPLASANLIISHHYTPLPQKKKQGTRMDVTVTAVAQTCPPRTLFYHFVICNYPTPPAAAAGFQTRLSVTSNNSWRGGRVRMGAVTSHNARANSQTLILGIKLLSGWHRMTRQSKTVRPLNFSPPNLQKNVWNDISTYQNKTERGREGVEVGTEGVL